MNHLLAPTGEADLAARLRRRDPDAFAELHDRHHHQALVLAVSLCRQHQTAEDVVQAAFFDIWRAAETYDARRGSLKTWLFAFVRHRGIDAQRRSRVPGRRVAAAPLHDEPTDAVDSSDHACRRSDASVLRRALDELPEAQRTVVTLSYGGDLSHSELSAALGIPLGTVKSRKRLALATLRASPSVAALLELAD